MPGIKLKIVIVASLEGAMPLAMSETMRLVDFWRLLKAMAIYSSNGFFVNISFNYVIDGIVKVSIDGHSAAIKVSIWP